MLRRGSLGSWFAVAAVAELLVFVAAADRFGVAAALLACFATTLFGFARLRKLGTATLRGIATGRQARTEMFADGALEALGALLLILPGFLGDGLGLALLVPTVRRWAGAYMGVSALAPVRGRRPRPGVIELGAEDWTRVDGMRQG